MKWNNGNDVKQQSDNVAVSGFRRFGFGRDAAADEEVDRIDFKMVTFSLAGKDYGIDIMKVKEIAKFAGFTYVPNTLPFVAGVYNLRGEIISIIDMRLMFNQTAKRRPDGEAEDGLILRLEHNLIGVIVDSIDRVVGISSESIQPPHPIFADINIKYISGVVEHEDRLYIILDVERIFAKETEVPRETAELPAAPRDVPSAKEPVSGAAATNDADFEFVVDGLATFKVLYASDINRGWIRDRYQTWRSMRSEEGVSVQFSGVEDAVDYAGTFGSALTGQLWDKPYWDAVAGVVPAVDSSVFNAWNPGCGKGFETYSLASVLKEKNPQKRIRIWAGDNDLLSISTAPSVVLTAQSVPSHMEPYVTQGTNGMTMSSTLRDMIMFEYHDILNQSSVPECHMILCRDVLSVIPAADQERVVNKFLETLSPRGVLIIGDNERLDHDSRWTRISDRISAYRKSE
ncbi:MAG: chemotaxis protein CheR [Spirochaetaceae bacterium]|nr:MAG: chemotaxis protein CheR [Spirochaetaceae bacterium]